MPIQCKLNERNIYPFLDADKIRTLRPRRSLLQTRPPGKTEEAAREQASLPIGATAKTMNASNASCATGKENEKVNMYCLTRDTVELGSPSPGPRRSSIPRFNTM